MSSAGLTGESLDTDFYFIDEHFDRYRLAQGFAGFDVKMYGVFNIRKGFVDTIALGITAFQGRNRNHIDAVFVLFYYNPELISPHKPPQILIYTY